jgi:hypothetical protein
MRVNEPCFLRDMYIALTRPASQTPPKLRHYSPMLHNSILAVASAFADDPEVKAASSRQAFANMATRSLEAECERPTLSAVIALSILANYHSSRKSPTLGYMYFGTIAYCREARSDPKFMLIFRTGISARISQACTSSPRYKRKSRMVTSEPVGLGVDCTPWVQRRLISPEGMRDRNWVFWTTFCQASVMVSSGTVTASDLSNTLL